MSDDQSDSETEMPTCVLCGRDLDGALEWDTGVCEACTHPMGETP